MRALLRYMSEIESQEMLPLVLITAGRSCRRRRSSPSHDRSGHVLRGYIPQLDGACGDLLADVVVADVDVLAKGMVLRVLARWLWPS
jgi:hypothetical protein